MYLSSVLTVTLMASSAVAAPWLPKKATKPPAFFLAGDSTTAIQATNGGGWGDGFLATLVKGATGINYGHNGATTVSFVDGGDWAQILASVQSRKSTHDPYVTIQFGHNDQKVDKNISVALFEKNLAAFVSDVRKVGGTPILVTSLSRRSFNSSGKIILNLAPQVAATLKVANETKSAVIDLNKASTAYLNAIGQNDAWKYNLVETDRTHLNYPGSIVFGNLVGKLIEGSAVGKKVHDYINLNKTIISAINKGVFIFPNVTAPA